MSRQSRGSHYNFPFCNFVCAKLRENPGFDISSFQISAKSVHPLTRENGTKKHTFTWFHVMWWCDCKILTRCLHTYFNLQVNILSQQLKKLKTKRDVKYSHIFWPQGKRTWTFGREPTGYYFSFATCKEIYSISIVGCFDLLLFYLCRGHVTTLILKLALHQEMSLQMLAFRLDYSDYYKRSDAKLHEPLTYQHKRLSEIGMGLMKVRWDTFEYGTSCF